MKPYLLKIYFDGTCPKVAKLAKELASCYKVTYAGIKVFVTFESECNIDAAEYSRDVMNKATEKGGFVIAAYLYKVNPNTDAENNYVADWEFKRNKGFVSDTGTIEDGSELFERCIKLDLK